MKFTADRLPYRQTAAFNRIVLDYIDQAEAIRPFSQHAPTLQGLQKAMAERQLFPTNREVLVAELTRQYETVTTTDLVKQNIRSLLSEQTFTITTAHQNNLFTGPLYFIYKILHVIRLARQLNETWPDKHFVPVFYIGSEDADLEELNHTWVSGDKLEWNTHQTGAVGRMLVDKELVSLIGRMEGQLGVWPNGKEIISALREFYTAGTTISQATFGFVNFLFAEYGLVILQPDNASLKRQMITLFRDDLLNQAASGIVEKTAAQLDAAGYRVQAQPREINLFYLEGNTRERIEKKNGKYFVHHTDLEFTEAEILAALEANPERFSPNVILRGLYQETILPNIAFIGGGGETAYWLQLKDLFVHYQVPFPVLVLRNSFLVVENKWQAAIAKLGFTTEDFFLPEEELLNRLVLRQSSNEVKLNGSLLELEKLYDAFRKQAGAVDSTLEQHVEALKTKTVYRLQELEKKMLRAEKRKFADQRRQIHAIRERLFPGNGLQERRDNIAYYYARWGKDFIQMLLQHSLSLEQEFVVLTEA